MFTGLIEEIGHLKSIQHSTRITRVRISAAKVLQGAQIGDSIACNGTCLTLSKINTDSFEAELMPETLHKTQFAVYRTNTLINLERAMQANTRLGGHIVSGHIDTVGQIAAISKQGTSHILQISLNAPHQNMIVEKGSIAIDGVSLTVIGCDALSFSVGIIPHTFSHTVLQYLKIGSKVNLEFDILGKYSKNTLNTTTSKTSTLSLNTLAEWGY